MLVPQEHPNPLSSLYSQKLGRGNLPPSALGKRKPNEPSHVSPLGAFLTVSCTPAPTHLPENWANWARELIMFILPVLIYTSILLLFNFDLGTKTILWVGLQ